MRYIYSFFLYCLLPLVLLRLFILGFRSPLYWLRWRERFGFPPSVDIDQPVIWLHAVSVGEVEAAVPVIERLLIHLPQYQIIITTVTPTGAQTVQRRFKDSVVHLYLPYDLPFAVQQFLELLKPSICVIMETELWPNLYHYCHQRHIPVVLVNARMSLRSLNGYLKFGILMKKTFACVTQVVAQSNLDAERIILAGCDPGKVNVAGNLKFDINIPSDLRAQAKSLRMELFPNRPVWIAASTHDKEEELILDAYEQILMEHKNCLLIIVPRHPQRFDKVADLCVRRMFSVVRKSTGAVCSEKTQIFLLDTLGELKRYYACADLAFVGGSMVPAGGHNMLEPASLGVPIISGKHVSNFQEVSNLLQNADAIFLVEDVSDLVDKVKLLLRDTKLQHQMGENGEKLIEENKGSADQVIGLLRSIIE